MRTTLIVLGFAAPRRPLFKPPTRKPEGRLRQILQILPRRRMARPNPAVAKMFKVEMRT